MSIMLYAHPYLVNVLYAEKTYKFHSLDHMLKNFIQFVVIVANVKFWKMHTEYANVLFKVAVKLLLNAL